MTFKFNVTKFEKLVGNVLIHMYMCIVSASICSYLLF